MNFAVYEISTGEIASHMSAPPDHVDIQCREGQDFFLDCPEDATHIINGTPVKKALELPLSEWKALAKDRIADQRWQAETGGVSVDGLSVKGDPETRLKVLTTLMGMQGNKSKRVNWKGLNRWASVGLAELESISTAMSEHAQQCFDKEMALSARIDAATTKEELDKIQW